MNIALHNTKYEGLLERKTNKWREYHVVLKGGQLYFYKDRSTNANLLGTLELSVTTFCNPEKGVLMRGYQFSVSTPSTETHLRASSAELRERWIREIMSAVTEITTPRPQHLGGGHSASVRSHQAAPVSMPESQVYDSTLVVHVGKVEHEWYWPGKSRDQAHQMLLGVDKCHFLVRDSGQEQGSYSLSVGIGGLDNKQVFHYMIKRDHTENKFILVPAPDRRFDTLADVIDFYLNLNREMELFPLKNPAHRGATGGSVRGAGNNMLPNNGGQGDNMSYVDPVTTHMIVVPGAASANHPASATPTAKQQNRKSVADILDEEFDLLDNGDSDARTNSYKQAVTQGAQNPRHEQEDTEYVRLGKFASNENKSGKKQQELHQEDNSPQKPPKPVRPGSTRDSEYMNVAPSFKEAPPTEVITSTSNGNKDGNYIYAAVGPPPSTTNNGNMIAAPGECLMIRGDKRSTPAVARFGNFGSSSLFEDAVIPAAPPPADNSCYVNFEINQPLSRDLNQPMNNLNMSRDLAEERPKSSGMSKSSVKAGKNKLAKSSSSSKPGQYYSSSQIQYPPAADGPPGYHDPCLSMSAPPGHLTQGHRTSTREELPPAATGPIGYTDPALSMTSPPTNQGHRGVSELDMFPAASPGMISYNDPSLSMTNVPARVKSSSRHGGNV